MVTAPRHSGEPAAHLREDEVTTDELDGGVAGIDGPDTGDGASVRRRWCGWLCSWLRPASVRDACGRTVSMRADAHIFPIRYRSNHERRARRRGVRRAPSCPRGRCSGRIEEDLEAEGAMSLGWYDVLLTLERAPGRRFRMQELSEHVVLSREPGEPHRRRARARGVREARTVPVRSSRDLRLDHPRRAAVALRRAMPAHLRGIEAHFASVLSDDELGWHFVELTRREWRRKRHRCTERRAARRPLQHEEHRRAEHDDRDRVRDRAADVPAPGRRGQREDEEAVEVLEHGRARDIRRAGCSVPVVNGQNQRFSSIP